jgi:RHS repeat-associated protein
MVMKKSYYSVGGQIIGEKSGGVRTDYLTDALGSVTATVDQTGAVINRYTYKPYGGLLAKAGVGADPSYQWVGSVGYRQTSKKYSDVYVRARHYDTVNGRWTSKDTVGLQSGDRNVFAYVKVRPIDWADPSGLAPSFDNCECLGTGVSDAGKLITQICKDINNKAMPAKMVTECAKASGLKVPSITCLQTWCNSQYKIKCDGSQNCGNPGDSRGFINFRCDKNPCDLILLQIPKFCAWSEGGSIKPNRQMTLCCIFNSDLYKKCDQNQITLGICGLPPICKVLHELAHICTGVQTTDNCEAAINCFTECVYRKASKNDNVKCRSTKQCPPESPFKKCDK